MPKTHETSLKGLLRIQKYHADRLERFGDRGEKACEAYSDLMTAANTAGRESLRNSVRSIMHAKEAVEDSRPFSQVRSRMKRRLSREIKALTWITGEGPLKAISREGSDYASGTTRYQHIPAAARTAFALGARTEAGFMLAKTIKETQERPSPVQILLMFEVERKFKELSPEYEGAVFWLNQLECESSALFEAADNYRQVWPDWSDNSIPGHEELTHSAKEADAAVTKRRIELLQLAGTEEQMLYGLFDLPLATPVAEWDVSQQQTIDAVFCQLANSDMTPSQLSVGNLKENIRDVHRDLLNALATDAVENDLREVAAQRIAAIESNVPQYPLDRGMYLDRQISFD